MGGAVVTIQPFKEECMEGMIPGISTVCNEEALGERGANNNINDVCTGEEEAYGGGVSTQSTAQAE
jgi:hypothetical protein